jgi:light-regulated signal transduction histidine kinase (bacteriophytochrome)
MKWPESLDQANQINQINPGLDICHDIIKVHNGEIKVETKEGEFAEFIILLPI